MTDNTILLQPVDVVRDEKPTHPAHMEPEVKAEYENFVQMLGRDLQYVNICTQYAWNHQQAKIEQLQAEVERLKLSKLDQENLRMGQMIQKAAETLPEDFEITVRIVLEAGGVELTNPDADTVYIDNDPDGLSHSIEQAINLAKEQAND